MPQWPSLHVMLRVHLHQSDAIYHRGITFICNTYSTRCRIPEVELRLITTVSDIRAPNPLTSAALSSTSRTIHVSQFTCPRPQYFTKYTPQSALHCRLQREFVLETMPQLCVCIAQPPHQAAKPKADGGLNDMSVSSRVLLLFVWPCICCNGTER